MTSTTKKKQALRQRRIRRVRVKIFGTASRPRLSVFRSSKHFSIQFINDEQGRTVAAASDLEIKAAQPMTKVERAQALGKLAAEKATKARIKEIVFDRRGLKFHGRVAALARAMREAGIIF